MIKKEHIKRFLLTYCVCFTIISFLMMVWHCINSDKKEIVSQEVKTVYIEQENTSDYQEIIMYDPERKSNVFRYARLARGDR